MRAGRGEEETGKGGTLDNHSMRAQLMAWYLVVCLLVKRTKRLTGLQQ